MSAAAWMHVRNTALQRLRGCRRHVSPSILAPQSRHTHRAGVLPHSPLYVRWQHSSADLPSSAQQRPPCIIVIGGGAIGSLFTALLTLTPQSPRILIISRSLSARPPTAPPVQIELLPATLARLNTHADAASTPSPFIIHRSSIFTSATALLSSSAVPPTIHAVLITTKGLPALFQAIHDADQLTRHYSQQPPPLIVSVMNGIAHLTHLPTHFPPTRLLYATTSQGAHWAADGVVRQAGTGLTSLVLPVGGEKDGLVGWFRSLVCSAAMDVRVVSADELLSVHWSKLLLNCVVNPLTALLNVRNGWLEQWLHDDAAAARIVRHTVREVLQVGHQHGVTFTFNSSRPTATTAGGPVSEAEVDAGVASVVSVVRATAGNVSSMASDVRAGRVTEVDGMNGEIVRLGERYGVETPYNRALWELVRERHPTSA